MRVFSFLPALSVVAFAAIAGVLSSCSSDTPAVSRLAMLTGGSSKTWHMAGDSSYTGLASNPCLFDNDYIFDVNGIFINRDNGLRCHPDEDRELHANWTLDDDSTTLSFGPGRKMRIAALSDTLMVIEELAPPDGRPERRTVFTSGK